MCGNKAGKLKNGRLPGVKSGYVELRTVVFGQLASDSRKEAAVVLECAAGNAPFPHVLALYGPDAKGRAVLKGTVKLEKIGQLPGFVHSVSIKSKAVKLRWYDATKDECRACATVSSEARVRLVSGKVKVDKVKKAGVVWAAKEFATALNDKDHKKVLAMTSSKSLASAFERLRREDGKFVFKSCTRDQIDQYVYRCRYRQGAYTTEVDLEFKSWKKWKAINGYAYD